MLSEIRDVVAHPGQPLERMQGFEVAAQGGLNRGPNGRPGQMGGGTFPAEDSRDGSRGGSQSAPLARLLCLDATLFLAVPARASFASAFPLAGPMTWQHVPPVSTADRIPHRSVRVSPQGDLVALADLPNGVTDAEGSVIVLDRTGRERVRLGTWRSLGGLAWSPDGREVWLSASGDGRPRTLHAVDLSGRERPLFSGPGGLDIEDVRADGRVLVRRSHLRAEVRGRLRGDKAERDLSLASHTVAPSLLPDGGALGLLTADESRGRPGAYLWRAGEAVPVRFADSGLYSLSPDGRTALCSDAEAGRPRDFTLVPTGPGEPRTLPRGSIDRYQWGFFGPDSRHVIFNAQEKGRPRRLFIQDTGGGDPRPLTPEGVAFELPRMTTTHVLNRNMDDPGDPWRLYPLDGGEPRPMPWLRAGDWPLAWDREGATLFLAESLAFPLRVLRLDVASGARRPWLETRPPDETAVIGPAGMELASDGCCYVYTYLREPAELFLVDGLH